MDMFREYMVRKLIKKFGLEDERVIAFARRCELYEDSETAEDALFLEYMQLIEESVSEEE